MQAPAYLNKVVADYKKGDYASVVRLLEREAARAPLRGEIDLLFLAQSHYKLGNPAAAGRAYLACSLVSKDKALAHARLAMPLLQTHGTEEDLARAVERLHQLDPRNFEYAGVYRQNTLKMLELDKMEAFERLTLSALAAGDPFYLSLEHPFAHIAWCTDEAINAQTRLMLGGQVTPPPDPARRRAVQHRFAEKIRIGYLSNDYFDSQAAMIMFQGVLAAHDREKFDITLFCYTSDVNIAKDKGLRSRNVFVSVGHLSDEALAAEIRARGIDILVDLKGYTRGARPAVYNIGAAPVQVAYFGYAASATEIDCDYVISDRIVLPDTSKPHYREKFAHLPDTYFCYDSVFIEPPPPMSRREAGLPDNAFVFAAFNSLRKINRQTVDLWARILTDVPGSLLWMLCEDPIPRRNLIAEFSRRGIAAERILFAAPYIHQFHLARVQAADLCLDTFPFNGHTTTADMLWAGLPVTTCKGSHFASRVSESVLRAIDMADLVAEDADGFVELSGALAKDPARLAAIRRRVQQNRFVAPLFDAERITRHLEKAYEMMVERAKAGLPPEHFDVPALPPRGVPFR